MPLQYDETFLKSAGAFFQTCSGIKKPAIHDVSARRENIRRLMELFNSQADSPDVLITEHSFDINGTTLSVFQFKTLPEESTPQPAILHCHGGGMIAGDVKMFRGYLRGLVVQTGVQIFSVDYRVAPESRSVSLTEDCFKALLWLHENAEWLRIAPHRIAVMGESAGGGLAAGVALMARDRHLSPPLAKQILVEPMLDDRNVTPVPRLESICPLWSWEDNVTAWTAVLGNQPGTGSVSPYIAPARSESLEGLPPTYIDVGQLDIFAEEVISYATRLSKASVATEFHLYPGLPHGFEMVATTGSCTQESIGNRRRVIRTL